jgi:biopolymer transport protein ExbB
MFQNMTVLDFLVKGGPVFIILVLASIYSLATIVERLIAFIKMNRHLQMFNLKFKEKLTNSGFDEAMELCRKDNTPVSDIFLAALEKKGKSKEVIEEAMSRQGTKLSLFLEKKLIILASAGSVTPFIGLFGTVLGIINAFKSISMAESFTPSLVTNGIAEALINTAAGLFVAIPAVIAYNFFHNRIKLMLEEIEYFSYEIVDLLKKE